MRHAHLLLTALALGCSAGGASGLPDAGPAGDLACPDGTHAASGGCATTLGWQASGLISPSRDHHGTFIVETPAGAFLYVIGGTDHFTSYLLDDVQRAAIAPDGSLGNLTVVGKLPNKLASMGVVVADGRVVIAGGVKDLGGAFTLTAESWSAPVGADGMLGAWVAGANVPFTREHTSLLARGDTIYIVGGLIGHNGTTSVASSTLAADGKLGEWSALTPLPAERSHHASVLAEGAIWVVGGLYGDPTTGGTSYNDVLRAALHDDGTLDAWTTVSTLPAALSTHSVSYFSGALYVFGGLEDDSTFVPTVRFAPVQPDGSLGAWQEGTPLPSARGHVLETPIWHHSVYSVGGYDNDGLTLTAAVAGSFQ